MTAQDAMIEIPFIPFTDRHKTQGMRVYLSYNAIHFMLDKGVPRL